jgi:hypothetical protein
MEKVSPKLWHSYSATLIVSNAIVRSGMCASVHTVKQIFAQIDKTDAMRPYANFATNGFDRVAIK